MNTWHLMERVGQALSLIGIAGCVWRFSAGQGAVWLVVAVWLAFMFVWSLRRLERDEYEDEY